MTPQQIEAMKLALEALRNYAWHGEACPQHPTYSKPENYPKCTCGFDKAITALEEALAEHAMREVQRLGQEIEQEPKIKTTDPFESSRVADYNRGWNDCLFASGVVKQTERHELQAKGEHPAPCARHCEANAFQIVIKNLKAQLAQRKPLTLDQICKALLSICDDGSAPTSTDDPEFVELIVPLARAIEVAHGIKENT